MSPQFCIYVLESVIFLFCFLLFRCRTLCGLHCSSPAAATDMRLCSYSL